MTQNNNFHPAIPANAVNISENSDISYVHHQEYSAIEFTEIEISEAVAAFTILRKWKLEEKHKQPEAEIELNLSCDKN